MNKQDDSEASGLVSRNVTINGRRTSLRLEPEMWEGLEEICQRERSRTSDIVAYVDRYRRGSGLTSSVRVFVLSYFRSAATERGHFLAGHGVLFGNDKNGAPANSANGNGWNGDYSVQPSAG
ncbi:ribbon-helix-helix domain-containing protein [Ferruginivarius sediminum]|uniref:Ribbon-helix-helix domain-containing protein n=1 Tax=Ferruginivarius sediminum TaxID=2661937 RepID=A0A369TE12_9PROT|nr:ribbon-helix-helix domain-containing protein [Ferruginivarius sediminum]RDD63591.1 hypothetical protein DRB17_02980 [Ferruginivarius sediminum]